MGVPAFFRWLTRKYPSVIVECVEEQVCDENGKPVTVDASKKNPNGVEFDNLYLDMNGIIHPCTHPENKPAPKNEDEMMVAIFECIDRLFKIVRPRKLLYMAIDGVAPRAKMNQQRSRRFRAAKETMEKADQIASIRSQLKAKGLILPPEKKDTAHFDSNCITPGTTFMSQLTECLNYFIHDKLTNDPGWKGLKVILSDASVPGEGEHKIMDFIRRQRGLSDHDPNTHHCLCGADADLIMLGLATHEPNFTIIREEFIINQPKRCEICAQTGHEMKECKGLPNPDEEFDLPPTGLPPSETKYIFVRLNVLREYLEEELKMPGIPFEYDFERAIDDWIFMCFFVGNDFLPHLPSLEIREGAIDRLINLYKRVVFRTGGFITNSGDVTLERVQLILNDLGIVEDEIFRKRQKNELFYKSRNAQRKLGERKQLPENRYRPVAEILAEIEAEDVEPIDEIRLWEEGYKERYYKLKFDFKPNEQHSRFEIGLKYAHGLCWVLKYYYQGCNSWKWFFPFHYAPFASDIVNISSISSSFEKGTNPFSPLEQLMGVFPAASRNLVPSSWAQLMISPDSPILDFYPLDFAIDLNGKRFAWQGVALLPFVDEERLRNSLKSVYHDLTNEEVRRNTRGNDRLYIAPTTDCYETINNIDQTKKVELKSLGVCGTIFVDEDDYFQGETLRSPIPGLQSVQNNEVLCVRFCDPEYPEDYKFLAIRLPGAVDPPRTIKSKDHSTNSGNRFGGPTIGMRPRNDQAYLSPVGQRMLRHNLPREFAQPINRNIHRRDRDRPYDRNQGRGRGGFWQSGGSDLRTNNRFTQSGNNVTSENTYGNGSNNGNNNWHTKSHSEQLRGFQQAARMERKIRLQNTRGNSSYPGQASTSRNYGNGGQHSGNGQSNDPAFFTQSSSQQQNRRGRNFGRTPPRWN